MKEILLELLKPFKGLNLKQKAIVVYFIFSFCLLCVGDETPVWIVALVVLNFANAARLIRKVPLPEIE
ncbi:MAG: hypothetical protein LBS07_02215 [Prevotellaceae bacterium]|jgi:hypothetical protein|nr:hypothetical protein [Prevotellaceae bacterium]